MAFELGSQDDNGMNEMNLIPLIDIMLVLMIIFFGDSDGTEPKRATGSAKNLSRGQ